MNNKRIFLQALTAKSLSLAAIIGVANCNPAWAIDPADDAGVFGSIIVARQAREGAKALKAQDYTKALNAYNTAIDMSGDVKEFYYGLLYAGQKVEAWDQVNKALDGIAVQDPAAKPHLAYEYGNCYTKLGRYDEAIPLLQAALKSKPSDQAFLTDKVAALFEMTKAPAPPVIETEAQIKERQRRLQEEIKALEAKPPVERTLEEQKTIDNSKVGNNRLDAFLKSEWIGICEYRGYQKKANILFNNPPTANFYWTECIKGPPLNHDMPIKFKFYQYDGEPKPTGWKFSEDKMPKIGSRWLIFIPNAIVVPGGFDTYKGSYGRQEANEENLGEIYAIKEAHHGQQ